MSEEKILDTKSVEDAFNLLVQLARGAKLTYHEHAQVSGAIKLLHQALNEEEPVHQHTVTHLNEENEENEEEQ